MVLLSLFHPKERKKEFLGFHRNDAFFRQKTCLFLENECLQNDCLFMVGYVFFFVPVDRNGFPIINVLTKYHWYTLWRSACHRYHRYALRGERKKRPIFKRKFMSCWKRDQYDQEPISIPIKIDERKKNAHTFWPT